MKKLLINLINKFLKIFNLRIDAINTWLSKKENFIAEISKKESEIVQSIEPYTMTSKSNSWAIIQAIKHIKKNNIQGELVECGVYKGGNIILFKIICDELKINKKIFAYDTFSGMSEPSHNDKDLKNIDAKYIFEKYKSKNDAWCFADLNDVKSNITKFNLDVSKDFYFIKGKVEDTLKVKSNIPEKISLLRLDTDFYESTKIELEILYPKLEKGGVLIIDDYGHWKGSKKAVDEYFDIENNFTWMHRINYTSRLLIK